MIGAVSAIGAMAFSGTRTLWFSYDTELRNVDRRLQDLMGAWWNLENLVGVANDPVYLDYLTDWRMCDMIENQLKVQAKFERSIAALEPPRFSLVGGLTEWVGH